MPYPPRTRRLPRRVTLAQLWPILAVCVVAGLVIGQVILTWAGL